MTLEQKKEIILLNVKALEMEDQHANEFGVINLELNIFCVSENWYEGYWFISSFTQRMFIEKFE